MKKIGILSDTHTYLSNEIFDFFSQVDEIWHAGDIGNIQTAKQLSDFKPLRAVYGNIDGQDIRTLYPEFLRFNIENINVIITHIGGYPGRYEKKIENVFFQKPPNLFICGHSHILKVIFDKKFNFLHINPGAFGISGFHQKRTAIRLEIDNKNFSNLQILELPKFSK